MKLIYPVDDVRITSRFGYRDGDFHAGTDFGVPVGTPVKAAGKGIVERTFYGSKGGNQVVIRHPNGWKTGYGHLNGFYVVEGEKVRGGQVIAPSGNTGSSTGPHLHFTVTDENGVKINPELVLKERALIGTGGIVIIVLLFIVLMITLFIMKMA